MVRGAGVVLGTCRVARTSRASTVAPLLSTGCEAAFHTTSSSSPGVSQQPSTQVTFSADAPPASPCCHLPDIAAPYISIQGGKNIAFTLPLFPRLLPKQVSAARTSLQQSFFPSNFLFLLCLHILLFPLLL